MRTPSLPIVTYLLLAAFSFSGALCTTDADHEEDACGPLKLWERRFASNEFRTSDFDGTTRTFTFEDLSTPANICPDKHTGASYIAHTKDLITIPGLVITGRAYWGLYGRSSVLSAQTPGVYTASTEIGLKQAFGSGPGFIGLQMHFSFPTKGSYEADSIFLHESITYIQVDYDYYEFK